AAVSADAVDRHALVRERLHPEREGCEGSAHLRTRESRERELRVGRAGDERAAGVEPGDRLAREMVVRIDAVVGTALEGAREKGAEHVVSRRVGSDRAGELAEDARPLADLAGA